MADLLEIRGRTHGDYEVQAAMAQELKAVLRRAPNWDKMPAPMRDSLEMDCVKTSRICCGDFEEPDHWKDKMGYASLILKILQKMCSN